MQMLLLILTTLIGCLHLFIMGLEMFGKVEAQAKAFDMPLDFVSQASAQTALGNQGIYNGLFGLMILATNFILPVSQAAQNSFMTLLMLFVLGVGLYGGFTATKKIFLMQCVPAAIALLLIFLV
ncbi:DUF1304 domain-containing protein [Weissella viridescens]|uniref:DUF1304 domain-containing protein n=1 Tax=Weissella viridescens TaxID=1629 RepID=A0A3P2RFW6_WEIVI|nr:DUF1304 domain-containing protein [Weissella viridescens]RRG18385.1 DUF1304 domain-containing protein [Weissella viridescens]